MYRKILLSLTISQLAFSQAWAVEFPDVTLGGFFDVQAGRANQEAVFEPSGFRKTNTQTNAEIHFNIDGETDFGLKYGATIEMEADVNPDGNQSGNSDSRNAERGYIYAESKFGRLEAGAMGDAARALQVDASNIARATGGIWGDIHKYVDLNGSADDKTFIISPNLPSNGTPGEISRRKNNDRSTANKINYFSPRIAGAQLGVSFTPDQGQRGTLNGNSNSDNNDNNVSTEANSKDNYGIDNVLTVGVNYQVDINDINFEASVTGEMGTAEQSTTYDDVSAYALGLSANFAGITVAGSYGDMIEFGALKTLNSSAHFWSVGASYEMGPFATSLTYIDSSVKNAQTSGQDHEFQNVSIGADYKLAPGLVPYFEINLFETNDSDGSVSDNKGSVYIIGSTVNF